METKAQLLLLQNREPIRCPDNYCARFREQEGFYLTLFEKAGDAVFIVSLPELDIYDANPQASLVFGFQKQELLSLNFGQLTENVALVKEKLLKKVTLLMNLRQKRKDGELFPASLTVAYFERNTKPMVIITVKDLSDAEKQQEEKDALLDLRRLLSERSGREIFAVLRGEQNERRRISRDIHDHIGQQLVSIKLELENQVIHAENQSYRTNILSLRDQMVSTISALRKLSSNIAGDYLPHSDWIKSLKAFIEHMRRKKILHIELNAPGNIPKLSEFIQVHVYRIIEESITNAIKHSKKKEVVINIRAVKGNQLLVQIVSRGISEENEWSLNPGLGLRIMYQRAKLIKSNLLFELNGQSTFIVHLMVPLYINPKLL